MAQRNIDFGTFPNDPDADAIRTAFEKVQLNFTELFAGLDQQGVLSVNQTPGDGISVFPVTGNVVVNANIATVPVVTSTLAVGLSASSAISSGAILTQSANQSLYIDLPANIVGVASANFSGGVLANTVTANSAITSSGTISATGNVSGGNLTTAGALSVTGNANVGNIGATGGVFTTIAGSLTTAAQPNITSVGTLTSLAVTGNITAGNANLGNAASANYFVGNGYYLTDVLAAPGNLIINANTEVSIPSPNSSILMSVAGNANIVEVTSTGANVNGYLTTSGNLTSANANLGNAASANYFIGNFYGTANSATTATSATTAGTVTTNAQPNITSVGTLTSLTVTGKVDAGELEGDGGNIGNIQGANVSGTVANATYATSAGSATSATTAGTVTTAAQPNITSVGTLTSLGVSGNITAANITANTGVFTGNGSGLSAIAGANVTGTVANATYALDAGNATNATSATSATTAGTVTTAAQPNITSVGTLTSVDVTGNVTAGNVYANSGTIGASLLTGALTTASQPNITSVGTLTNASVTGNVIAGNVYANSGIIGAQTLKGEGGNISNIQGANVSGTVSSATTAGTVTTNAQPNITSVGTLSSLSVTGNISSGNANLGNLAVANFFSGDGSLLTNISVGAGSYIENGNSEVRVDANSNVRVTVAGNANVLVVTGTGANITGTANVSGNLSAGNISTGLVTGTLTTDSNAQPNITSLGTLTALNVNGVANLGAIGNVRISGGSNNQVLVATGTGSNLAFITATTLTTAPGSNTQVVFNDAGSFAANANLSFDKTNGTLSVFALGVTNSGTFGNVYANSGTVRGNLLTGTLTTNAQPNITSIGTLSGLIVNGTINAGRTTINPGAATSNVHALTVLQTWNNSSVQFSALEANITDTASAANSLLLDLQVANTSKFAVSKEGNVFFSGVITGDGGGLSNVASATSATNAAAVQSNTSTASTVYLVGTATAGNANVSLSKVTGIYANMSNNAITATTFVGALSGAATSATTAGTVTTAAQPNITSVGTLTGLGVNGNIIAANITANTGVFTGNAAGLTNIPSGNLSGQVANALVAGTVYTAAQPNITSVGTLTSAAVTGNVTAGNVYANSGTIGANVITGNLVGGTLTTAAQPNITSVGTLTSLGVSGNITAANITANTGIFTGNAAGLTNIPGANVTGTVASATTAGTVTTAAQPNITSTGTLSSLTVSGNITAQANVTMSGYVIRSVGTSISAAGTTQANATAITKEMNVVSTVASGAGVVLPTAVAGMVISITNTSANSLLVYPATGAAINTGSANAAYTQPAGATLQYLAPTTTQWYTVGATFA